MVAGEDEKGKTFDSSTDKEIQILPTHHQNEDISWKLDEEEEEEDEDYHHRDDVPSPESAGIARGAAKTILSGTTKRGAATTILSGTTKRGVKLVVGKKRPLTVKTTTTAGRPPKFPNRLRARQVSKISDRLSTGLDVVSSATEESSDNNNKNNVTEKKSTPSKSLLKSYASRVVSFTGSLIKNSILGIALFETYEGIVEALDDHNSKEDTFKKNNSDAFSRVSISHHFVAGAFAGLAFSTVSLTFRMMMIGSSSLLLLGRRTSSSFPCRSEIFTSSIHSVVSNSTLFGSYEGSKRMFLNLFINDNNSNNKHSKDKDIKRTMNDVDNTTTTSVDITHHHSVNVKTVDHLQNDKDTIDYSVQVSHLIAVSCAGIVSGMSQNIVNHYMEAMIVDGTSSLRHENNTPTSGTIRGREWFQQLRHRIPKRPTLGVLLGSVHGTAIGFVAFEYGKDLFQNNTTEST